MLQKTSLSWIETNFARFCGGLLKFYSPALSWTKPNKPTIRWLLERCRLPIVPWPYEAMHDLLDLTSEFPWWKLDGFFSPLPGPQARGVREGLYGLGLGARNHKNEQIKYFFTGIVADIPPIGWPPFFLSISFQMERGIKRPSFVIFFWNGKKRNVLVGEISCYTSFQDVPNFLSSTNRENCDRTWDLVPILFTAHLAFGISSFNSQHTTFHSSPPQSKKSPTRPTKKRTPKKTWVSNNSIATYFFRGPLG